MLAIQNATSDDVIAIFAYEFKLVFFYTFYLHTKLIKLYELQGQGNLDIYF